MGSSFSTNKGTIITSTVVGGVVLGLGYYYFARTQPEGGAPIGSRILSFVTYAGIAALLAFGIYFIYQGTLGDQTSSGNLSATPVDSSSSVVIPGTLTPPQSGVNGGNYGVQWWMYVKDWNYKFGEEKPVLKRGGNPYVYLHPTENSLCVKIDVFSNGSGSTESSEPAPTGADGSATDDTYTCVVKNIPLQKWCCVSLSVSGRNVDIYLDGLLVRSCLLPGVPKSPLGNLEIMPGGGFSGNVIDVYHFSRALKPADATSFCSKGTGGASYDKLPSKSMFGYTVKFGVVDDGGKEIKQFTF
jgi:hypothetical protein